MNTEQRKALVFGKNGQLAWELQRSIPRGWSATALGSAEINLLDSDEVADAISAHNPDLVINAAAYTAVDKAETEKEQAFALNGQAVANVAESLKRYSRAALIHVSTDFVFDGRQSHPYTGQDAVNPLSVYGASKLAGEREILDREISNSLILRTSWVYSSHGQNFVKTMVRLMADPGREQLNIVYDQIGTPTWARSLADAIWTAGEHLVAGQVSQAPVIYNWTDAGVASWYDFAVAIQELGLKTGLLDRQIAIRPIPHTGYPTPAARPPFSVLDKSTFEQTFGASTAHWRSQLASMLEELISRDT